MENPQDGGDMSDDPIDTADDHREIKTEDPQDDNTVNDNPSLAANDHGEVELEESDHEDAVISHIQEANPIAAGEECKIKNLYRDKATGCDCCEIWADKKPIKKPSHRKRPPKKEINERDKFAILQRHILRGDFWTIDSIIIQSTRLHSVLKRLFQGYPEPIGIDESPVEFSEIKPIVHFWEKIVQAEQDEGQPETKEHIGLLISIFKPEVSEILGRLSRISHDGNIPFHDIGYYFQPGWIVLHNEKSIPTAGLLRTCVKTRGYIWEYYSLEVDIVFWNGRQFGVETCSWNIYEYRGMRRVTDLDVFPIHMSPKQNDLKQSFTDRGKKYVALRGQHVKHYKGAMLDGYNVLDERVIIDMQGYHNLEEIEPPTMKPLKDFGTATESSDQDDAPTSPSSESLMSPWCFTYEKPKKKAPEKPQKNASEKHADVEGEDTQSDPPQMTEAQLICTRGYIRAFALKSRKWCYLDVALVQDIEWVPNILESLVISEGEKSLVAALLQHSSASTTFDDFMPGKGRGVIMLLYGPPGTGKTFTAEAVSEHLRKPLYRLGMSDLGLSVTSIEKKLNTALKRCARFKAVLLIDEADVFLEQRSTDNLERNELVSVFLRLLEYYEGVMVLTTNRINAIDTAFESRIDIILAYEDLTKAARFEIWQKFMEKLGLGAQLSDKDLDYLAEEQLNGRQIKSAVKSALILASAQKSPVLLHHVETVVQIRRKSARLLDTKNPLP